jgi:hypothetical protein
LPSVVEDGEDPAVGGRVDEIGMPNLEGLLHGADDEGNKRLFVLRFSDLARVLGPMLGQELSKLPAELMKTSQEPKLEKLIPKESSTD